jgi:hypothetical protein
MRKNSPPQALSCRRTWLIFLSEQTILMHCFNSFNVRTYHSELTVASLSNNNTNKIPSLSQKLLLWLVRSRRPCHLCRFHQWWIQRLTELTSVASSHTRFSDIYESLSDCSLPQQEIQLHSWPSMYVHQICQSALLQCWMHVTDLSTNDPGGAGQWYYLVGKGRNSTKRRI